MKRKLALLMACTLTAASLIACGKEKEIKNEEPVVSTDKTEEKVEEVVEENAEVTSAPTYAITSVKAEGYDYFTGRVECIQITDDKHAALADAINAQFADSVSAFNKSAESMNKEAEEADKENKKYADENPDIEYYKTSYSSDTTIEVVRADSKIFSFIVYNSYYTGGAHGMTDAEGYTYDSNTGKMLDLSDFGDKGTYKDVAMNYIIDSIANSNQTSQDMLFTKDEFSGGYEENVKLCFEGDTIPAYYLNNAGVVFIFQQYSIAPYASGLIEFTVPFKAFEGFNDAYILKDEFYSTKLSDHGFVDKLDVNGDGELDKVSVYSSYNEADNKYTTTLMVNDATFAIGQTDYVNSGCPIYYVHATDGNYIIYNGDKISVFEVSKSITLVGEIEGQSIKEITDGKITVGDRNYGDSENPWSNVKEFNYSKSGISEA